MPLSRSTKALAACSGSVVGADSLAGPRAGQARLLAICALVLRFVLYGR